MTLFAQRLLLALIIVMTSFIAHASIATDLNHLKTAYPDFILSVTADSIRWRDGTSMSVLPENPTKTWQEKLDHPTLYDQLTQATYVPGVPGKGFNPSADPGRIRYEPFFKKMYGESASR